MPLTLGGGSWLEEVPFECFRRMESDLKHGYKLLPSSARTCWEGNLGEHYMCSKKIEQKSIFEKQIYIE